MYRNGEMFPAWVETLGSMAEKGWLVRAICSACRTCVDVDIPTLIEKVGPDFCLIDRRPACRTPACKGRTLFMFKGHGCMLPLQTERVSLERSVVYFQRDKAAGLYDPPTSSPQPSSPGPRPSGTGSRPPPPQDPR